jgi:hypothetical protein
LFSSFFFIRNKNSSHFFATCHLLLTTRNFSSEKKFNAKKIFQEQTLKFLRWLNKNLLWSFNHIWLELFKSVNGGGVWRHWQEGQLFKSL